MLKPLSLLLLSALSLPSLARADVDYLSLAIERASVKPKELTDEDFSVNDLNSLLSHGSPYGKINLEAISVDRAVYSQRPILEKTSPTEGIKGKRLACVLEQLRAIRDMDWRAVGKGDQDLSNVEIVFRLNVLNERVDYGRTASTQAYLDPNTGRVTRLEIYDVLGDRGRGLCAIAYGPDLAKAANDEIAAREAGLEKEAKAQRQAQDRENRRLGVARQVYQITHSDSAQ